METVVILFVAVLVALVMWLAADLVVTAASVVPATGASLVAGTAGETLTHGQPVYQDGTTNLLLKGDAGDANKRAIVGITVGGGAINQKLLYATSGSNVNLGATLTPGTFYYLSNTAGGICPVGDVLTGMEAIQLGYATSASNFFVDIKRTNVVIP